MVAACPFPSPQGSQVLVRDMSAGLARRGHDVHLLTYGQGDAVEIEGVRHERIRRLPGDDAMRSGPTPVKPLLDLMMVARLARMLARGNFDVLHCHNYEAAMIGLATRAGRAALAGPTRRAVPVIYHSHNMMGDELPSYFSWAMTRALGRATGSLLDRTVPRAVDQAIALCDYTATALARLGVSRERLSVIPPAVDDPGPCLDRAAARLELAIAADATVVAYTGNLDGYQNLGLLIGAFAVLCGRGDMVAPTLVVATHGEEGGLLRQAAAAGIGDRVKFVRAADFGPVRQAIAAADVVVMPRRLGSGFPVKLVNYLAAGRAVVTTGCGAKLIRDGIDGLVVRDDDPDALASALGRVLADPELAARLEGEARRTYLSALTWEAVLPAIEGVYDRATETVTRGYRAAAM
jgi:glycosyltransferase involved in cell wall biosynthesis